METSGYSISNLVDDLRRAVSEATEEGDILSHIRPLARRAALSKTSWLELCGQPERGFGVYLLHEKVTQSGGFAMSWLPHRGAPPHDHGTWAVVAGVDDWKRNEFFQRLDDPVVLATPARKS
jgi:predicted metal-dependent enzyme (double-stranded beta helix superfamily)